MSALIADSVDPTLKERLEKLGIKVDYRPGISREELVKIINRYSILVFRGRLKIDREIIDAGRSLKILARYGVGLDNVDVEYAVKRGISVVSAPNSPTRSVAELTIALIFSVARRVTLFDRKVKAGEWPKGKYIGMELAGKTLGIVGFGRIGKAVAQLARGLDMKILASDVIDVAKEVEKVGGRQVPLEDLLRESDVVSIHVPLTPQTYRLLDAERLSLLRDGAILVNTSRGEVIDHEALLRHIDRLWGVGLDVLPEEPPKSPYLKQLIEHEKVVVTPHVGSETYEAMKRLADELAMNLEEVISRLGL
ncbi:MULTISPECIES: D-2-hydroxyacid dehydrogenase [Pyrobaculum]|uniref:D-3-phosphoglycerate dehydrogenase n=2 Tax=Pyrobaculum arsenaticum TaxID=121277 RepID=A4WLM0_PYRAR|nr:D-2-hydroxyacid dehydrogenase [Pyrobaculum arsenaticum]ABP51287.1 D-3-phosphoglycerate dehydrogenase [Pyrobaculum arsenaticum DSM 13514]MCY0889486.1 D-2-hydroxyacid dehydrogenase [Pyrobaculum arsenaticum]NYR16343.1 3-phosphoglycerate dehydrogenase [Pyrobaculum arsenaticum]